MNPTVKMWKTRIGKTRIGKMLPPLPKDKRPTLSNVLDSVVMTLGPILGVGVVIGMVCVIFWWETTLSPKEVRDQIVGNECMIEMVQKQTEPITNIIRIRMQRSCKDVEYKKAMTAEMADYKKSVKEELAK